MRAHPGHFLEIVAQKLEAQLDELGSLAARADEAVSISSMCVVFAETEIIGLLSSGQSPENIAAGVQQAIAVRVAAMAGQSAVEPVYFAGGVARVPGMREALERALHRTVIVSDHPQCTGAIGAALVARERHGVSSAS